MPDRNIEKTPKTPTKHPKGTSSRWVGMKKFMAELSATITAVFTKNGLKQ